MPTLRMTPEIRKRLATKPHERTRHGTNRTPPSKGLLSDVVNFFSRRSTRRGGKRKNTKRKTHKVRRNKK
jgi:hypothetical protein